jgi:predicted deacylase
MNASANQPGIVRTLVEVTRRGDGSPVGIPVITVTGARAGPTLLVVGGTHGDEQEGIGSVLDLVAQVDPGTLAGTLIAVTALNFMAYEHHRRGNPLDDWFYDMNRLFPGSPTGSLTQRTAHMFCTEIVPQADLVIAIHSGGSNIYCCERVIVPSNEEKHLELARAMGPGWEIIAGGVGERTGIADFTSWAARQGKATITLELGGVNHRLPEAFARDVKSITDGLLNVMRHYKMIPGQARSMDKPLYVLFEPIRNNQGGYLRFGPGLRLKEWVKKGELFVTVVDVFGNELERIVAPRDCIPVAIPAKVSLPTGGAQIMSIAWLPEEG